MGSGSANSVCFCQKSQKHTQKMIYMDSTRGMCVTLVACGFVDGCVGCHEMALQNGQSSRFEFDKKNTKNYNTKYKFLIDNSQTYLLHTTPVARRVLLLCATRSSLNPSGGHRVGITINRDTTTAGRWIKPTNMKTQKFTSKIITEKTARMQ